MEMRNNRVKQLHALFAIGKIIVLLSLNKLDLWRFDTLSNFLLLNHPDVIKNSARTRLLYFPKLAKKLEV